MGSRRLLAVSAALALLLAGCSSAGAASSPDWSPQPSFPGDGSVPGPVDPNLPQVPAPSQQPATPGTPSSGSSSPTKITDPNVVATHLSSPIGIAILPDNTALVGERSTGRIVLVQPEPGQPVRTVRTLTGLSTSGGGGLLDLALSPTYSEDGLIFAYITTPKDNRVVDFTLTGPVTPVLTGIPKGSSDNEGRIVFGADGTLFVGTGDAGTPADAASATSLAGKVLDVTTIGTDTPGDPRAGSPIYASGLKQVDALCVDPTSGTVFEAEERGQTASDPVNAITVGASYGWPSAGTAYRSPLRLLPDASRSPGGCAVENGVLYLTSRDGQALLSANIGGSAAKPSLGTFNTYLRGKYGRLRSVVAAADGALWITTSNRDGLGKPVPDDERVLRIQPPATGSHSPV